MKRSLALLVSVTALAVLPSCHPVGNTVARGAIDVAVAACIASNADESDERVLREICRWTDDLAPYVKELLRARQEGLAKAAQKGVCRDAADSADGGH